MSTPLLTLHCFFVIFYLYFTAFPLYVKVKIGDYAINHITSLCHLTLLHTTRGDSCVTSEGWLHGQLSFGANKAKLFAATSRQMCHKMASNQSRRERSSKHTLTHTLATVAVTA